ncbi:MAG: uracil-DNA glycosylase [Gammaproteobacteria bacterium]|nr:uracil-DNA glycosylase [Gammaproteobacteria bacterium]
MTSGRNNTAARGRQAWHDANCADCARLSGFLAEVKRARPDYMCKPVPPFGARRAELLVVGLAPGLRGANATGRPFTGDHAGILLYRMLHRFGFASAPHSRARDDGLRLRNCRVTNAVKCLPPGNKPLGAEVANCSRYLAAELAEPHLKLVLALGGVAHRAVLRALGLKIGAYPFAHAARHELGNGLALFDSYHCSRYNTNTRRLTEEMFARVFAQVAARLKKAGAA